VQNLSTVALTVPEISLGP